ncbi:MAG: F-box protein [Verrucomicrobia bacterium]|nr:F-box protein [Verrucomicrobiota bacterium]
MHSVFRRTISTNEHEVSEELCTQFSRLPEDFRNAVYFQIYHLMGAPQTNDSRWGEQHVFDDTILFQQALTLAQEAEFSDHVLAEIKHLRDSDSTLSTHLQVLLAVIEKMDVDPNQPYPINELPVELLQDIFRYLSPRDQYNAAKVCELWQANVHQVALERVPVIDQSVWERYVNLKQHGLSFEDLRFPSREALTKAALDLAGHVEADQGVSIIAIPKGLSFSKLLAIGEALEVRAEYIWGRIEPAIGAVETEQAYVAVLSNGVLQGSRSKSIEAQDELIQEMGCEVPSVADLLTAMIFHKVIFSKRLFSDAPWTYSLTSDSADGYRLVIGGFAASGFDVINHDYDGVNVGAGGLRKF